MQYRFKMNRRQFQKGDLVPKGYDKGTIGTMLAAGVIEEVPDDKPVEAKRIDAPPADKMLKPYRVRNKAMTE